MVTNVLPRFFGSQCITCSMLSKRAALLRLSFMRHLKMFCHILMFNVFSFHVYVLHCVLCIQNAPRLRQDMSTTEQWVGLVLEGSVNHGHQIHLMWYLHLTPMIDFPTEVAKKQKTTVAIPIPGGNVECGAIQWTKTWNMICVTFHCVIHVSLLCWLLRQHYGRAHSVEIVLHWYMITRKKQ